MVFGGGILGGKLPLTPETVIDLGTQAIKTVLLLASPMLLLSLAVGLLVSAFQAMTQIQEATLSFGPKIVAVFVAMIMFFPWLLRLIVDFTTTLLENLPMYIG